MSARTHVLAIDQGTTSSRAMVFDHERAVVGLGQREHPQRYPHSGWVEHDAAQIWSTQAATIAAALHQAGIRARDLAAIGITNQRETTVVWDRHTGQPIGPAIGWQDRRTAERCAQLLADSYFSATKLEWLLQHVPGALARASRGTLAFGTVDSWLIWNLTAGRVHVTDISNASRTMLFNIHTGDWDDELQHLLATVAWRLGASAVQYALEGSVFVGGAAVQWLRDGLGLIRDSGAVEALARQAPDTDGVHFVPAFTGLGAPYWDPQARGALVGLTRGTSAAHIARATLEAIAFQSTDVLNAMQADSGRALRELRVDGGGSRNALLMQFRADLLGAPVVCAQHSESTALGAACLAGVGAGLWSQAEVAAGWRPGPSYLPHMSRDEATSRLQRWALAVASTRSFQ